MMRLEGLCTQRAHKDINCSITGQLIKKDEACARWGDDVALSATGLRELLQALDQTATDGAPRHVVAPAVLKAGYTLKRDGPVALVFHDGVCVAEFCKFGMTPAGDGVWVVMRCAWDYPLSVYTRTGTEAGLIQWFNDVLEPRRA